ncbi:uncharacterized protein RAG0_04064 [Rhynchosporium agropyri]|uniref:Uncharacterized protein n=1 Tax=Rhynchosporium agropyri TaxID=914238 RepID=A0A1E1K7G6_9HELO|nr:uncharacterized protein RAG0_04064 [Rhynchosporium agropyri]
MPSHQVDGARAPSSSQSAFQPPAWITYLSAQGISIHGTKLTEDPHTTWRRQELAHHEGKSTSSWSSGPQAISAERATRLRNGEAKPVDLKRDGAEKSLM